MIRSLEKSGETAGIEAKSAILHGLAVTGRLEEALALYAVFKRERLLPHSYAVGTLLVRDFLCSQCLDDPYSSYGFVCYCLLSSV